MAKDPLTQKLEKASRNVSRLRQFFVDRRTWGLSEDAASTAKDFVAAVAVVDEHLKKILASCGAQSIPPARSDVEPLPDGVLDRDRLSRFTTFLRDLDGWFSAQPDPPTEADGIAALQQMEACLVQTIGAMAVISPVAVELIKKNESPPDDPEPVPAEPEVQEEPAETEGGGSPTFLVLDDTDERPMTQEFREMQELTPDCIRLVDEFLLPWGIQHEGYARKKFLERLLRWITSAPDGQVLVLKISRLKDPFEPYPAYVSRDKI